MKRKIFLWILFYAAFLCLSYTRIQAVDWVPVGAAVGTTSDGDTWAYSDDGATTYQHGDQISPDIGTDDHYPDRTYNTSFVAASDDYTLNIYGTLYTDAPSNDGTQVLDGENPYACPLKIDKDVLIDASNYSAIVNIMEDVVIEPYLSSPSNPADSAGYSQIYFNSGTNKTITVNVDHNITFKGKTIDQTTKQDLIVTFKGTGKTIFAMADGTTIQFTGQVDTSGGVSVDPDTGLLNNWTDFPSSAAGTKVFVTMDQTSSQVNACKHKLVFQRKTYAAEVQRTMVYVGPNSTFTYLSDNPTGIASTDYAGGFAAVAFDPTNPDSDSSSGSGRMVFFIKGAYDLDADPLIADGSDVGQANPDFLKISRKYPFNDGAVVIAGHYVRSFAAGDISGSNNIIDDIPTPTYDFSIPAGVNAILRVADDKAYAQKPSGDYNPSTDARRGLLVINDCQNFCRLFSDPYWDLYGSDITGTVFAPANPVNNLDNRRKGFIVGVNGMIDVYHNCFLEYVAGSINQHDLMAEYDYTDPSLLKLHNPAALIMDGVDTSLFVDGNPLNGNSICEFDAANPFTHRNPSKATINLRGTGALYLKSCAASGDRMGYIYNFWTSPADGSDVGSDSGTTGRVLADDPIMDPLIDYTAALSVADDCIYDGYALSGNDYTKASGEGDYVLDVEGPAKIVSVSNNIIDRTYASTITGSGLINMATVLQDYTGAEIYADGSLLLRPLLTDSDNFYSRYNSPGIFLNNFIEIHNSIFRHSDVTKYVDGIPNLSEPAITGGERLYFSENYWGVDAVNKDSDPNRYRFPELQMYNTTLELWESLNVSGIRWIVTDIPGSITTSGNNASTIRFFDHGDALDTGLTGFGRVFMFGSSLNLMADDLDANGTAQTPSSNYATESAYFNVFKHNALPSGTTVPASVGLSIRNGNQFPTNVPTPLYGLQRAQHLFMFSIPNDPDATTNMRIGWPTISGDSSAFPSSYPYPGEALSSDSSDLFTLDALTVPPATVSLAGKFICFGSFDKFGNGSKVPVATINDSGIIYVDHGGKITIPHTASANSSPTTYQSILATTLAMRVWNDYTYSESYSDVGSDVTPGTQERIRQLTGIVDFPQNQIIFDGNASIQPYGFTQEMWDAHRDGTNGNVRINLQNADSVAADRSGAGVISIGWFYRDLDLDHNTPIKDVLRNFSYHRFIESVNTPVTRPTDLLYIGAGDDIKQLRVSGATLADPFMLNVAGDAALPISARVREFTSQQSTHDHFIGEGAHASLFVQYNGRIGLGSRNLNEHSVNAWNLLGKDFITICPLGDGQIDVNSNLIVSDRQALLASDQFGVGQAHRLTFYSNQPREIRIPANCELDLSSFGKGDSLQEIAFAGKIKLIFEEGSTLRLPDSPTLDDNNMPLFALYFKDDAELIFEGSDKVSSFIPFSTSADTQLSRIKIIGKGLIWLNDNATMSVMDNAHVAVQSDALTPYTNLVVSLRRQSELQIGNADLQGGSFEIGNPSAIGRPETDTVAFSLLMDGPAAVFHLDRQGFFGLAAGVINKYANINGDAQKSDSLAPNPAVDSTGAVIATLGVPTFNPDVVRAWQIEPLLNVTNITLQLTQGTFEHKNIANGSSDLASLMAVGPVSGNYTIAVNDRSSMIVKGGGNIMYVPVDGDIYYANIWDYAGTLSNGESYSILASAPLLLDRQQNEFISNIATINPFGANNAGNLFVGDQDSAYNFLGVNPVNLQGYKKATIGSTSFGTTIGYTNQTSQKYPHALFPAGAEIIRYSNPTITEGSPAAALTTGAVNALVSTNGVNANQPVNFSPVY